MEAIVRCGTVGGVGRGSNVDLVGLEPRMDERIAVGGSGLCRHRRWKRKFCFVLVKFDLKQKQ